MARDLSTILVIDLESTCWQGAPPKGEVSDIIEVGLCLLDVASLERSEKRSILVRPERSSVSPFCTELTTLTQAQVSGGVSLAEACQLLRDEYRSRDRLWASFGDYDRRQFERCCAELGVPYPFGPGHLNVKTLLAVSLGLTREHGLARALEALGLELEGTHHRGHDDAWNIAAILAKLLAESRRLAG